MGKDPPDAPSREPVGGRPGLGRSWGQAVCPASPSPCLFLGLSSSSLLGKDLLVTGPLPQSPRGHLMPLGPALTPHKQFFVQQPQTLGPRNMKTKQCAMSSRIIFCGQHLRPNDPLMRASNRVNCFPTVLPGPDWSPCLVACSPR